MEFYDMPIEIRKMIFDINRRDAVNKKIKNNFNKVLQELEEVIEESQFYFGYEDEDLKYVGLYQYIIEYLSFHYLS
jgi:hypothetical protein